MVRTPETNPNQPRCPACKAAVRRADEVCAACGHSLREDEGIQEPPAADRVAVRRSGRRDPDEEDEDDRPRRRRDREDDDEDDENRFRRRRRRQHDPALGALVPMNQSGLSIASGYLGLLSCVPCVGFPLGIVAILCGVFALRAISRDPELGGSYRAIIGIVLGGISMVVWGGTGIVLLAGGFK